MKKLWYASLLTAALGFASVPAALAQTCPAPCPPPCPVVCPKPCPEKPCCPIEKIEPCPVKKTCPVREKPCTRVNNINSNTSCCPAPAPVSCAPLSGQVSQGTVSGWGVRQKTIVMEPGQGQVSIDNLGLWNKLYLTLINPTDEPLVFETTQRIGKEKSWTVAPHSQRCVSMRYTHPFSDEVKFRISQEPGYAMAHGGCCPQRTAEAVQPAPVQPAPTTTFVVPVAPPPSRSTIRGFW
jgi:hypothetical protein